MMINGVCMTGNNQQGNWGEKDRTPTKGRGDLWGHVCWSQGPYLI